MDDRDQALIEAARSTIAERYAHGRHHVACAVRMRSGEVYTGVHVETHIGRMAVCAESVAVGRALTDGEEEIDTIVSVRHPRPAEVARAVTVVPPCGICRELIAEYGPSARVLVPADGSVRAASPSELLPWKFAAPRP